MKMPVARVSHPTGDVFYAAPNEACAGRAASLFTKEPDTIAWIAEFNPGDVFVDVGANVGMYSIWAARTTGARVFAFEPESQNFAVLCTNIVLNQVDVLAFPFALSDEASVSKLYLSQFVAGGSCHTFGEKVNYKGKPMTPSFVQGACAFRLDSLVDQGVLPWPDHIKIDVDGIEDRVLSGMGLCLFRAKSVLVEIDTASKRHERLIGQMEDLGFRWDHLEAEAARRKSGAFAGIGNVIFRR